MLKNLVERLFPYYIADAGKRYIQTYSGNESVTISIMTRGPGRQAMYVDLQLIGIDGRAKDDFRFVKGLYLRPDIHSFRLQMYYSDDQVSYVREWSLQSQWVTFGVAAGSEYALSAMFRDEHGDVLSAHEMRHMMIMYARNRDKPRQKYDFVPIMYSLPERPSPLPCSVCDRRLHYAGNIDADSTTGIVSTLSKATNGMHVHDRWGGYICERCNRIICDNCHSFSINDYYHYSPRAIKCECGGSLLPAEGSRFESLCDTQEKMLSNQEPEATR